MSEDTRVALGIPKIVQTNLGPVEVRSLSARETVVLIEKFIALGLRIRAEVAALTGANFMTGAMIIFEKYPDDVLGLAETMTNLPPGRLGDADLDGLFLVFIAGLEQHEVAINRFFELRATWERVAGKVMRHSPSLSISSSAAGGATTTSNGSPSSSSNSSPDSSPSEESKIASSA